MRNFKNLIIKDYYVDYLKDVVDSIKPILKEYGMKKQGHNWYIENDVIVKIFNIQKSMFGKQLYLNIGIKIKKLENNISSTFPGSHIGTRLDHLIEKDFLDFENSVQTSQRNEAFSKLLKSNPYNFFTLVGTDKELRDFISKNNILSVFKIAKDYLNIKE